MTILRTVLATCALAFGSAAHAAPPPNLYPMLSSDSKGWTWYLRKDTLRVAATPADQLFQFTMIGENRGSARARNALARVKLSCVKKQFVQLRLVSRDVSGSTLSAATTGDHQSNWKVIEAGTPTDGAHKLLCEDRSAPADKRASRRR